MWKPWLWRLNSPETARRNALHASAALAQRRLEREEVETYLLTRQQFPRERIGA